MKFGEMLKARRLELGLSLRAFCQKYGEDPSNWSKLERGLAHPPTQFEHLNRIRKHLRYGEDSHEARELFEIASIGRGEIPDSVLANEKLMEKLPLVFRTISERPSEEDLMRLADIVRDVHTPDA